MGARAAHKPLFHGLKSFDVFPAENEAEARHKPLFHRFVATLSPVDAGGNVVALNVVSKYLDLGRVVLDAAEPPVLSVIFDLDRDA